MVLRNNRSDRNHAYDDNNNTNHNIRPSSSTSSVPRKSGMTEHSEEEGITMVGGGSGGGGGRNSKSDSGKLTFVRDDRERFDLPDLLKASAEVLGSGCFGSSYKATLNNGSTVVVKRFKQMNNVGREEFQEHMRRLGRLSHPNLLPLVAYYYRKEEKLFINDPVERGSLAVLLHGTYVVSSLSIHICISISISVIFQVFYSMIFKNIYSRHKTITKVS